MPPSKNAAELGSAPVGKLLLKFSIPAMIGTMVFASTNIVNTIFIGRGVGSIALTAISLSFPVFSVFMALGMLVGIGSGALISIRLGQGKKEEAESILGGALFLFVVVSLSATLVGEAFLSPLLRLLGASDMSLPYARDYLRIILCGSLFNTLAMGMNNIIRAEGNPGVAMYTLIIGAIINVGLNYLFVMHLHYGVRGAALATMLSTLVTSTWVLLHFISGRSTLKLHFRNIRFDRRVMVPAMLIGLSPFLMQLAGSLVGVFSNKSLAHYGGDHAVGAMAIIFSSAMLVIMPIIGINQGVQPVLGFNYGARNYDRVRKALRYAILAATAISTVGCLLIHIAPGHIVRIFSKGDPIMESMATQGLNIFLACFFIVGFQAVSANYFQAVGKPKTSILLNLLRQVILFLPLLLILPLFFKLKGIWYTAPISDVISATITAFVLRSEYKRLKREASIVVSKEPGEVRT